jgi:hypothetical protein
MALISSHLTSSHGHLTQFNDSTKHHNFAINLKAKENFCMTTMLLFYIVQIITLNDAENFSKINCHTPYQESIRSVTSMVYASHIYMSTVQLLLTVKN